MIVFAGKLLYAQCAGTMKKVSMELGGNAPFIVFDSADVNQAVDGCMKSKFRNTGQTCVATNRVLVQEGIYAEFVSKLKEAAEKSLVLGDGMDDGVNQGPLINESQFKRVCQLVDDAKAKGAKVVTGKNPTSNSATHCACSFQFEGTCATFQVADPILRWGPCFISPLS